MNKSKNGITLIALVITIIVLLILAGVTISRIVKKDGVVGRATQSAQETAIAKAKEEVERVVNEATTASMVDNNGAQLAAHIDERLRELARSGSQDKDIRYEYIVPEEESGKKRISEAPLFILQEELAAVAAEPSSPPEVAEAAAAEELHKAEIHTLNVYYKDNLVLRGELNMDTGSFVFIDPNEPEIFEPLKPLDKEKK